MTNQQTVAVFGATGKTGILLVEAALANEFKVKALARNPLKLTQFRSNANLSVIQGDFTNIKSIEETVEGADYVISLAGGPTSAKAYPRLFIHQFLQRLVPVLAKSKNVKSFVYTGVMFVSKPDGSGIPFYLRAVKPLVALAGLGPAMEDHTSCIRYLGTSSSDKGKSYKTIVIRPGVLSTKSVGKPLVASSIPYLGTVGYQDLANFILEAMFDEALDGQYPFVRPTRK